MVHPKIALFWGAEKNRVPYMAYTAASLTTSPSQTQQGFQDMVSWLTNVVFINRHDPCSSRHILDIGLSWIGSNVYVFWSNTSPTPLALLQTVPVKLSCSQCAINCWRLPKRFNATAEQWTHLPAWRHTWLLWSWTIFLRRFLLLSIR